jgi:hypothetical protein
MASKIMLEVTQPVVSGNEVVVHSGELFEPGAKLPEGVTVRPVITDVPDKPAKAEEKPDGQEKPAKAEEKPAQDKPAAKTAAK